MSFLCDASVIVLYSSAQSGKTRKITHAGLTSPARHFPGKSKTLPTGDLSVWEEAVVSFFLFLKLTGGFAKAHGLNGAHGGRMPGFYDL